MLALIIEVLLLALWLYASVVATLCLLRDESLSRRAKLARVAGSWLLPFIGSILTLRSAAEVSPDSLPARGWLIPLWPCYTLRRNASTLHILLRISSRRLSSSSQEARSTMSSELRSNQALQAPPWHSLACRGTLAREGSLGALERNVRISEIHRCTHCRVLVFWSPRH